LTTVSLEDLRAYEARLIRALADPTRAIFYDDFKRENRPVSELETALSRVRVEIAKATASDARPAARRIQMRHRCSL